jgi:hypothetical protein
MRATSDYTDLITQSHADKPRFVATVGASVAPLAGVQAGLESLLGAFDVDSAVGVQLDAVGLWVGASRRLQVPISDVYFTWESDSLGWESGVWRGVFDPATGLAELPDDAFRLLIKTRIATNSWRGTTPEIYTIWESIFGVSGLVVQDYQNMSMAIGITNSNLTNIEKALLRGGYIPLKPAGVRLSYYYVTPGESLFAWDVESTAMAGWETGRWAEEIGVEG